MIEQGLETGCKRIVEARGGRMLKLVPAYETGIPDRLVIMPGGRVHFVEFKRPGGGGSLTPKQDLWRKRLGQLGCNIHIIDSVTDFMEQVCGQP